MYELCVLNDGKSGFKKIGMSVKKNIGIKGKVVNAQSREIIANVIKFMKSEAAKGSPVIPIANFKQRVLEATGVSTKTYKNICKEIHMIDAGIIDGFTTPRSSKKHQKEEKLIKFETVTVEEVKKEFMEEEENYEIDIKEEILDSDFGGDFGS